MSPDVSVPRNVGLCPSSTVSTTSMLFAGLQVSGLERRRLRRSGTGSSQKTTPSHRGLRILDDAFALQPLNGSERERTESQLGLLVLLATAVLLRRARSA